MSEFYFFSKIFDCRFRNLSAVLFSLSRDVIPKFSGPPPIFLYKAARFLRIQRERERMRLQKKPVVLS